MHLPSYGQPQQTNKVAVGHRFRLPVRPRARSPALRRVPPSGQLTQTTMVCPLLSRRAAGRRNRKCLASVASVSRACSAPPPSWRPMASQIDQHFVDRCLARSAAFPGGGRGRGSGEEVRSGGGREVLDPAADPDLDSLNKSHFTVPESRYGS